MVKFGLTFGEFSLALYNSITIAEYGEKIKHDRLVAVAIQCYYS
jgi:hypothetical protein